MEILHFRQRMKCLADAAGQGLVEYAVILLFVVIAVVAAVTTFGQGLSDFFMNGIRKLPFP
jgi:Flp pilus assembly pilin Flp